MKSKILGIIIVLAVMSNVAFAQNIVKGTVKGYNEKGKTETLGFANVVWVGTTHGAASDADGNFKISRVEGVNKLTVSYMGYRSDTITVKGDKADFILKLDDAVSLAAAEVKGRQDGSFISKINPIQTEVISGKGLQQLACCNLSESFENSVTVDVGYADAVTGAKTIQMLGLAGSYSQFMFENMPYLRGLDSPFGLSFIPGTWMQSIAVSKGTSSVVNGYESISGQISVDFKKPEHNEVPFSLNAYANSEGRMELNLLGDIQVSDNVSTMIMGHVSGLPFKHSMIEKGWMDYPRYYQVNLLNRWSFEAPGKYHAQITAQALHEERTGGMLKYDPKKLREQTIKDTIYGSNIKINRVQLFGKFGFFLNDDWGSNIGLQVSAKYQDMASIFGLNDFNANQTSGYFNAIFNTYIAGENMHKLAAGLSFQYDNYNNRFANYLNNNNNPYYSGYKNPDITDNRQELVPGVFAEYNFNYHDKINILAGFRYDYNSAYGSLYTPRFHVKYNPWENTSLKVSAGKGYRSANVLMDNFSLMASSRVFNIAGNIDIERAWNYGASITQTVEFGKDKERSIGFNLEYYFVNFQNQVVVDLDRSPQEVNIYNLDGISFAHTIQAEINCNPFKGFDFTLAYRYNDSRVTEDGVLVEKAYSSKHKGLFRLSYATKFDKWRFDVTNQLNGSMRLPNTQSNPTEYRTVEYSPTYYTLNAQITRKFKKWEIYIGGENITNYTQKNTIIDPANPFGKYFDSSMVWGPLMGITGYIGVRVDI